MDYLSNRQNIMRNFFLVAVIITAWSCDGVFNKKDYEIKSIEVAPTEALPLAYGDLSIEDILSNKDSQYIKVYPDGLVYLDYDQSLKSQAVGDLVIIPDKNNVAANLAVPPATYPPSASDVNSTQQDIPVTFDITPEKLTEIFFKSGTLTSDVVMTPNNPNFKYAIKITIPEFTSVGTGTPFSIETSGVGKSFSLQNYVLNTGVANTVTLQVTLIIKQNPNSVTITPGTTVNASISFKGLNYKYVKGFLGDQLVNLPEETLAIQAFGSSLLDGATISFAQPKINFKAVNEVGVPTKIYFTALEARKPGSSLPIIISPASPVVLTYPNVMGDSATTLLSVSNMNALLNFAPTQFYYKINVHINEGLVAGNNFVTDTSKLKVYMHVEVPLYGHATNIQLSDTVEYDLTDADESQIASASLKIKTINQLPLSAKVQFYLTDDNYKVLDSLLTPEDTNIIKSSQVTATGELASASEVNTMIPLPKDKLDKLFKAKKIIIRARVNTTKDTNGNYPDVKFKSAYKMNIKLGLQVTGKIKVDL